MLNEYGPGELPGGDVKGASKDVASYKDLEQDAKHIFANCVLKQGLFGWMQAGMICHGAFSYLFSNLGIHSHHSFE